MGCRRLSFACYVLVFSGVILNNGKASSGSNVFSETDARYTENLDCKLCLTAKNQPIPKESTNVTSQQTRSRTIRQFSSAITDVWERFPTSFVPRTSRRDACKNQTLAFLSALKTGDLWALKMFDASAKLPAGILNGNLNQFGDFDQCLAADEQRMDGDSIRGKYCLAYFNIELEPLDEYVRSVDSMIHSHHIFRSNIDDVAHRVPVFSSFQWGICMPAGCSAQDLRAEISAQLKRALPATVRTDVRVSDDNCYSLEGNDEEDSGNSFGYKIARFFFVGVLTLTAFASIYDRLGISSGRSENKLVQLLACFSLPANVRSLVRLDDEKEEIRGLHAIRCMHALFILLCHKSVAMLYTPYANRTAMTEGLGRAWAITGRAAIIYTDSFILLSGLLTAHSLFVELKATNSINFTKRLISRLFRFVPSMTAIIFFCTYILPSLGSGPLWSLVVTTHSNICKQNMWRNFIFIHNFYGFENMCLTHTHQVGLDMHLFLLCPIFVYLLYRWPSVGLRCTAFVAIASTILRFWVAYEHNLTPILYFGTRIRQVFDTANLSYTLATHRATMYLIGVFMAYVLQVGTIKYTLNKIQLCAGWSVAITCCCVAVFGFYPMARRGYIYNATVAANYNAFAPIIYGAFLSWLIFAANNGCAPDWLQAFAQFRGFRLFTRIGYGFYLIQFPIFFFNIGRQRTAEYYRANTMLNINEVGSIFLFATVLTVMIEMPFANVHKVLFSKVRKVADKSSSINNNVSKTHLKIK